MLYMHPPGGVGPLFMSELTIHMPPGGLPDVYASSAVPEFPPSVLMMVMCTPRWCGPVD